ncbi:MAG: hypothetical protein H6715_04860 [Myxococcales bacterium]|nr:hypothetical protein [Myxococcales bacterium]
MNARGAGPSALPLVAILGVVVGIAYLFSDSGQMQFHNFMDEVERLDAEIKAESDFERRQSMTIWGIARAVFSTTNGLPAVRDIVTNFGASRQLGSAWLEADDAFWQATSLERGSALSNFIGGYGSEYRRALAVADIPAAQVIELRFVAKELSLIVLAQQASIRRILPASTDDPEDAFDPDNPWGLDEAWQRWHAEHPDATGWEVKSEAYIRELTRRLVENGMDTAAARQRAEGVVEKIRTQGKAKWDAWELERAGELIEDGLPASRAIREAQTLRKEEGLRAMLRELGYDEEVIDAAIAFQRLSRVQAHRRQIELSTALQELGLSAEEAQAVAEVVRQMTPGSDFGDSEQIDTLLEHVRGGNTQEVIDFMRKLAQRAGHDMDSTDPTKWYQTRTTKGIYEHARAQYNQLQDAIRALHRGLED